MGEEEVEEMTKMNEEEMEGDETAEWNRKYCKARTRLEQLALPNRHHFLCLWQSYACYFPPDKQCYIKKLLEELFPMTPEDIEKYFNELRKAEKKRLKQKADRAKLKKLCKKKYILEQEKKAYNLFSKILKQAFQYAINHQIPPLVSVRLRNLSNVVLEQLCDILCCKKPDRYNENKNCTFLVSIADWIAIEIERVYYIINLKKNLELEKIEELEIEQEKLKEKEKPLPVNDEVEIQMDQAEDGNLDEME